MHALRRCSTTPNGQIIHPAHHSNLGLGSNPGSEPSADQLLVAPHGSGHSHTEDHDSGAGGESEEGMVALHQEGNIRTQAEIEYNLFKLVNQRLKHSCFVSPVKVPQALGQKEPCKQAKSLFLTARWAIDCDRLYAKK
jgi:hypothetical protein